MPVTRNAGGALCAVWGDRAERAGGGPTDVNIKCKHARQRPAAPRPPPLLRSPLSHERQHKHTRHHKSHSRGARRGAARLLGAGDTVPECTIRRAATTDGVPANCPLQPALPYAAAPTLRINPIVSETGQLPVEFGNQIWFYRNLPLTSGLNRPHSTKHTLPSHQNQPP